MYSLTRAVISVLLKDLKELPHVPQKKSSDLWPPWTSNKHPLTEEMGKAPAMHNNPLHVYGSIHVSKENIDMTTTFYFRAFRLISFHLENRFEHLCDSHDRWLGWKMHSITQQTCTQTLKKSIYGGKVLVLISANATLSFYCPAPSLSLESALRHTVKASWNIWKKWGRVREREATVQKAQQHGQDVALLFSGSPSFSFQHHSRTVLSPQAACLK